MINFNVDPYRDDFDPSKHFHRILFKPGRAVQARELTQSQTILQDQISKFANHVFNKNTPVTGGQVTYNKNCNYIKLTSSYNGIDINVYDFLNRVIRDSTGTVEAKVIAVAEAVVSGGVVVEPPTLIIVYLSSAALGFKNSSIIYSADDSNYTAQAISSGATGLSATAHINSGVFYIINGSSFSNVQNQDGTYTKYSMGHFVSVDAQTVILSKYSNNPTLRVGLDIQETIYDYIDDVSLLDPALGTSNYQAPGADRYVIKLNFITKPYPSSGDDENFIELVRIENGVIVKQVDETSYARLDDYFAKRLYDTNGNYVVNGFKLTPKKNSTNTSVLDIGVSSGLAYVSGYRTENPGDNTLTIDRARTFANVNNNYIDTNYGNFLYVDNLYGRFLTTTFPSVHLHVIPSANVSHGSNNAYNSSLAGVARIRNMKYDSYVDSANVNSYVYKAYLTDLSLNSLSSNVSSVDTVSNYISLYDPSGIFSSSNSTYNGCTITLSTGDKLNVSSYMVYGSQKRAYVSQSFGITPTNSTTFSINFSQKDIKCVTVPATNWYGSFLSTAEINSKSKSKTGLIELKEASNPEIVYKFNRPYVKSVSDSSYKSKKIFTSQVFTNDGGNSKLEINILEATPYTFASSGTVLGESEILDNYQVIVTSVGTSNVSSGSHQSFILPTRSITISNGGKTATLTSNGDLIGATVDVTATININNADDINGLILKKKTLYTSPSTTNYSKTGTYLSAAKTYVDSSNCKVYVEDSGVLPFGQKQSLFMSDVKRVTKIIEISTKRDITSYYSFDSGQTDYYYDHANISLRPGSPEPDGDIVIFFDYYEHSAGDGCFTVMSYDNSEFSAIRPYISKSSGLSYPLGDSIDFRPKRKNKQIAFELEFSTNGASFLPEPDGSFVSDYSYYLGRKDLIVLTKDRTVTDIQGVPSTNPAFPNAPDGSMILGRLTLEPYTLNIPDNITLEPVLNKRFTMKDIGDIQTRLSNIEYYSSLSLLEQQTNSIKVNDSSGIARFKNGILADNFSSFITADASNPDFSACIIPRKGMLTAKQYVENVPLKSPVVIKTNGSVTNSGLIEDGYKIHAVGTGKNIYTLPYTTANIISQPLASSVLSVNPFNVIYGEGIVTLNPSMDNWVDNKRSPDVILRIPGMEVFQEGNVLNSLQVSDWKVVPGTEVTTTSTSSSTTNTVNHNWDQDWGFGLGVGVSETTTTTTSVTTATLKQDTVTGYYNKIQKTGPSGNPVSSTYQMDNNVIRDVSILSYIRPQEILITAQNLAKNSPVTCLFDGEIVNQYMTLGDIIEVTNVTGRFKPNDIIGFYDTSLQQFFPIATVINVSDIASTATSPAKVRLTVAGNLHTSFSEEFSGQIIKAGVFNPSTGQYSSYSANGNVSSSIISSHLNGKISAVGGSFTTIDGNNMIYYSVSPAATTTSPFGTLYGIWSNPRSLANATIGVQDAIFEFTVPSTGTYKVKWDGGPSQTGYISVANTSTMSDQVVLLNGAMTNSGNYNYNSTIYLTSGKKYIRINSKGGVDAKSYFAAGIYSGTSNDFRNGTFIFHSRNCSANSVHIDAGSKFDMPGYTGLYYTGVRSFGLGGLCVDDPAFYDGSKIRITNTKYYNDQNTCSIRTFTANVQSYNPSTNFVTLKSGETVDIFIGPNGDSSRYTILGEGTSYDLASLQGKPSDLSTDKDGNFVAVFNLPENKFKTGERVFRVDNRLVATEPDSATYFAESTFVASGLSVKSQSLSFGSSLDGAPKTFTQSAFRYNQVISSSSSSSTDRSAYDPLAQTFLIDPAIYPNGAFLSHISFFFKTKPANNSIGITAKVCETINGYPGGAVLDYSTVTLFPQDVTISNNPHILDPETETIFKFKAPVYVSPGKLYSVILRSNSEEYRLYVAEKLGIAIASTVKVNPTDATANTTTKIGNLPAIGALFESQNAITWVSDANKSLMTNIHRCVFDVNANPVIPFVTAGLTNKTTPTQVVNDLILEGFTPVTISGQKELKSHAYNITTTDYVPSAASLKYRYIATQDSTRTKLDAVDIIPGKYGHPTEEDIYLSDGKGERVLIGTANDSFILECIADSTSRDISPVISDDGLGVFNIQWEINDLSLLPSQFRIDNKGLGYSNANCEIFISAPDLPGGTQAYANTVIDATGRITAVNFINGNPGSGYLNAPTITITGANTSPASIRALSEFSPTGGNATCKYITKKVTLNPQNESQDLRAYFTAYRPLGTNIYVFYKLLSPNDPSNFVDNSWKLMTMVGDNKNFYSLNRNDIYEYEAAPGVNNIPDNFISYVGSNGITYDSFVQFAIKIVMTTSDKTKTPFLTSLRVLALPNGTGLI